jgi:cellobiose-specific phosphotransferase system component IIC
MSPSSAVSRQSSDASKAPRHAAAGWLERRVAPLAERFGNAPAARALREALPVSFGGLLVALAVLVPFIEHGSFIERLRAAIPPGFALMSAVLVLLLSWRLALLLRYSSAGLVLGAVAAFLIALPSGALSSFARFGESVGTAGPFTAIVCCLAVAGAVGVTRTWVRDDLAVWIGAASVCAAFALLRALHLTIGGMLGAMLLPLGSLGDSFVALFLIAGIEAGLWVLGIHGPAFLAAIVLPVYLNLQVVNSEAALHHAPLPHKVVVSTFLFVFPGGVGATLPLVLLLLRSRVTRLRRFAYAVLAPSLFNLNEPVLFGLPLVYNPILGLPFVLAPLALVATTYTALSLGWVRSPAYYVPSPVPLFANVFLATFDWRAIVLVALNLVVAGAIYLPFLRVYERAELAR